MIQTNFHGVLRIQNCVSYVSDLPSQGESPCTPHTALKKLIERLIQESLSLPLLQKVQDHPARPNGESNRTYEDLLATAVINKVSKQYLYEGNRSIHIQQINFETSKRGNPLQAPNPTDRRLKLLYSLVTSEL